MFKAWISSFFYCCLYPSPLHVANMQFSAGLFSLFTQALSYFLVVQYYPFTKIFRYVLLIFEQNNCTLYTNT
ncbi:hypothetical protein D3C80_423220 [compost metagenome]